MSKRLQILGIAGLLALVGGVAAEPTWAYPKPSIVPLRWQLELVPHDFSLHIDSDGEAYWYFTYTVSNRTNRDQRWAPQFDLVDDIGGIHPSGIDVPDRVTNELLELLGNPLLETQTQILGELLQGESNARDGLVIWPARNLQSTELSMYIQGLSGESVRVSNPATGDEKVLRKTLRRDYLTPGEPTARDHKPLELIGEEWIMR